MGCLVKNKVNGLFSTRVRGGYQTNSKPGTDLGDCGYGGLARGPAGGEGESSFEKEKGKKTEEEDAVETDRREMVVG